MGQEKRHSAHPVGKQKQAEGLLNLGKRVRLCQQQNIFHLEGA